jgi:hypothetical protein
VAVFGESDARRLGCRLRDLKLMADTDEDEWWRYVADPVPDQFLLRAAQALLQQGPRLVGPTVTGPLFDIRDFLDENEHGPSAQAFRKALGFLTGSSPDYENAVKEAVGALESRARQMTGAATLGDAVPLLVRRYQMPKSIGRVLTALYGFRSAEPAVGHGGVELGDTSPVEARAMVNACAAALLFLLQTEAES